MTAPKSPSDRAEQQEQEKWYERTQYQIPFFAGGIVLFILLGGLILDWYIAPKTPGHKKDLVQALGLITAGVAGAVGIYFTYRGQRHTRQAQEENQRNTLEQLEQSRNELEITRRGQITGRFTQAVEQLGSESLEIRLGGIYSLGRTAHEDRDYHWPIMEVLSTYVRTHALRKRNKDGEETTLEPDTQAVLTIIGRRAVYHRDAEYGTIDLHATDLASADLRFANLQGVAFWETDLSRANLRGANLAGAKLPGANLQGASLEGANLQGAYLWRANLQEADLWDANLQEADLWDANLQGAKLYKANLQGANLYGANLQRTGSIVAQSEGERITYGYIPDDADLQGLYLQMSKNYPAAEVIISPTQEQINQASGGEATQLPPHLKPPAHWNVKTDEQIEGG